MTDITKTNRVNDLINTGMDGRPNRWLKDKLAEIGITLSDASISQRLSGQVEWTGNETLACFEILNIKEFSAA